MPRGRRLTGRLGIPGEELPGSWAATDFVGWYNGHPDHPDLEFDLTGERAVVIGNGNVALDVARMLVLSHEELSRTDVADHALQSAGAQRSERGRGARAPRPRAGGLYQPRAARAGASSPAPT